MNEHSWKDEEGGCLMSALTVTGAVVGLVAAAAVGIRLVAPAILETWFQ